MFCCVYRKNFLEFRNAKHLLYSSKYIHILNAKGSLVERLITTSTLIFLHLNALRLLKYLQERLQFACKNIKYRILTRLHNPITLENIWNKCTVSLPAIHLHKMIKKLYDKRSLDDA